MYDLIDKNKKAMVLERIRNRETPLCAMKPEPEKIMKEVKRPKNVEKPEKKKKRLSKEKRRLSELLVIAATFRKGNLEEVKDLIGKGADVNYQDEEGISALMQAAACKDLELVKFLISDGANVYLRDFNGNTALDYAEWNDPVPKEIVKLLTEIGAKRGVKRKK